MIPQAAWLVYADWLYQEMSAFEAREHAGARHGRSSDAFRTADERWSDLLRTMPTLPTDRRHHAQPQ